ncbi:MAG: hypothetical protein AAF414_13730 [Pseudomonadota bacterium]
MIEYTKFNSILGNKRSVVITKMTTTRKFAIATTFAIALAACSGSQEQTTSDTLPAPEMQGSSFFSTEPTETSDVTRADNDSTPGSSIDSESQEFLDDFNESYQERQEQDREMRETMERVQEIQESYETPSYDRPEILSY